MLYSIILNIFVLVVIIVVRLPGLSPFLFKQVLPSDMPAQRWPLKIVRHIGLGHQRHAFV